MRSARLSLLTSRPKSGTAPGPGSASASSHIERFRAMGTRCHIQVEGDAAEELSREGRAMVADLERLWSRFLPDSDVSRLNRSGSPSCLRSGVALQATPISVDPRTVELLSMAVAAWRWTDGRFSPFLERAMNSIGYSKSWDVQLPSVTEEMLRVQANSKSFLPTPASGTSPVVVDGVNGTATLAAGFGVDLGGIAKGFAADAVLRYLLGVGAQAALVDLGGDIAFGQCLDSTQGLTAPWSIAVEDPFDPSSVIRYAVADNGGMATSSTLRRRWAGRSADPVAGEVLQLHHLLDPTTGRSAMSGLAAVTVLADTCCNAEVLSKQFLLLGCDGAVESARSLGIDCLLVTDDGVLHSVGEWDLGAV